MHIIFCWFIKRFSLFVISIINATCVFSQVKDKRENWPQILSWFFSLESANRDERKTLNKKKKRKQMIPKKIKSSLKLTSVKSNKWKKTSLNSLQLATKTINCFDCCWNALSNQLQMENVFVSSRRKKMLQQQQHEKKPTNFDGRMTVSYETNDIFSVKISSPIDFRFVRQLTGQIRWNEQ